VKKKFFYKTETDKAGRILKDFELSSDDCACEYEMVCKTADYFSEKKVVSEIIVKFKMEDPKKKVSLTDYYISKWIFYLVVSIIIK
jgi:5-hydroxyisourate hydrolase